MGNLHRWAFGCLLALTAICALLQPSYAGAAVLIAAAPDDTGRNARDRGGRTLTPLDQGNSKQDVRTTAAIRQAVVHDDGLSIDAHNVKIITNRGHVTLRGPVDSTAERDRIEALAKQQRSVKGVTNELEVKSK